MIAIGWTGLLAYFRLNGCDLICIMFVLFAVLYFGKIADALVFSSLNECVLFLHVDDFQCDYLAGKQLMLHVAELVPRHPNRTKKQEPASTSSNAGPSKSGKSGKKKR